MNQDSATRNHAPAWIAWAIVAATLVGVFMVGVWLVVAAPGGGDDNTVASDQSGEASSTEETPSDASSAPPESGETPAESAAPAGEIVPLNDQTTVTAPGSAPPNNDVDGSRVTFIADNMLDGDPTTAWRLAGDQTSSVIDFRFASPVTITSIGLINGYAKVSTDSNGQSFDWYHSNRQILQVQWTIAGQTFDQPLTDSLDLQGIDIPSVSTDSVQLTITSVSPPGASNPRDYTAISDVLINGFNS